MSTYGFFSGDYLSSLEGGGVNLVASAGTAEVLGTADAVKGVIIQALETNTGYIAVGGSDVDYTPASRVGIVLAAGQSITLMVDNINRVYIDSSVSGEGVSYLPLKG